MPKPHRITTPTDLDRAIAALMAADERLHAVIERAGKPPHRHRRKDGFEALVEIVVSQQLSTAAADTIFGRLKAVLDPFEPAIVLAADAETLRGCGLSAPKQKHMKTIAAAILDGTLDLKRVKRLADEDARAHLTAVKGIGPWTADIYLMSSLGRADIWPVGDVALQAAIARALKLRKRPNEKAMEKLAKNWRPYRTIAARIFWIHEDGLRREKRDADARAKAAKKKKGKS
ncbi:MAG: DNA-3-methyladenine glycosylase 2 family protein [Alphaproteobacteria bacterium]|jgi:DNA-3-methyladenine glycosylase II|nr:DNA-3-methyladenine glycosylase 2 family protein [Alphaproteobacteria bacterium]